MAKQQQAATLAQPPSQGAKPVTIVSRMKGHNFKLRMANRLLSVLKKKVIIISPNYIGLGNRLKFLASYHVNYGLRDTTLFWSRKGWVSSSFGELFRLEGVAGFKERSIITNSLIPVTCFPYKQEFRFRGFWRLDVQDHEVDGDLFDETNGFRFPAIDFAFAKIPQPVIEKYRGFFDLLKPSRAVQQRISEIPIGDDVVRVHVRNSKDAKDYAKVPEIKTYLQEMGNYPSSTRFFISTMDPSVSDIFFRAFKDRILELPNKNFKSMTDAVADMYLLSGGRQLILSPESTFSEVAWWLGGCRQEVIPMPIPKL